MAETAVITQPMSPSYQSHTDITVIVTAKARACVQVREIMSWFPPVRYRKWLSSPGFPDKGLRISAWVDAVCSMLGFLRGDHPLGINGDGDRVSHPPSDYWRIPGEGKGKSSSRDSFSCSLAKELLWITLRDSKSSGSFPMRTADIRISLFHVR